MNENMISDLRKKNDNDESHTIDNHYNGSADLNGSDNTEINYKSANKSEYKISLQLLVLILIIGICAIKVTYQFATQKQGYHSDEIWNYGLTNSYYSPHIYMDGQSYDSINCNQWRSTQDFKDYLTVDQKDRFSYDSVIHNQIMDLNPPLYYMALHTICSMFPGVFSRWFAYAINLIAMIVTMAYLYRCIRLIHKDAYIGMIIMLYYGLCTGALNMYVFLRFYATTAMWTTMFTYYCMALNQACKQEKEQVGVQEKEQAGVQEKERVSVQEKEQASVQDDELAKYKNKLLAGICLCTFFGALTAHVFLIYAFLMIALYCMYYLISGRMHMFIKLGVAEAGTVLLTLFAFPATIAHLLGDHCYNTMGKYDFMLQFRMCVSFLTKELFGIHTSVYKTMFGTYLLYGALAILFFLIPVAYLCRKEEWFTNGICRIKVKMKRWIKGGRASFDRIDYNIIFILLSAVFEAGIVARTVSVYYMGEYTDRYLFCVYPAVLIAVGLLISYLLKWIIRPIILRRDALLLLTLVLLYCNINMSSSGYLFEKPDHAVRIDEVTKDSNVIVVLSDYWLLTCYTNLLMDADHYYATNYLDGLKQIRQLNGLSQESKDAASAQIMDNKSNRTVEEHNELPRIAQRPSDRPTYVLLDASRLKNIELPNENNDLGNEDNENRVMVVGGDELTENYQDGQEYLEWIRKQSDNEELKYIGFDQIFGRDVLIYQLNES